GGKNAVVVLDDADLDRAATLIAKGAFGLSGQACTGTSRVIVHDAVHDALDDGAQLVVGGPDDDTQDLSAGGLAFGQYVRPTVFTGVDPASELATEEVFGPVLAVLRVHSLDEALQVADATRFGLSAGIVTADIGRAMTFARRVTSGLVKVNQPTTGQAMNAPFGGLKH